MLRSCSRAAPHFSRVLGNCIADADGRRESARSAFRITRGLVDCTAVHNVYRGDLLAEFEDIVQTQRCLAWAARGRSSSCAPCRRTLGEADRGWCECSRCPAAEELSAIPGQVCSSVSPPIASAGRPDEKCRQGLHRLRPVRWRRSQCRRSKGCPPIACHGSRRVVGGRGYPPCFE